MHRAQRPTPADAQAILHTIPKEFQDDGCTNAPDAWFGFELRWACRIHDWRYCSRCHRAEFMGQSNRHRADAELARNVQSALPWRWRWVGWIYLRTVDQFGGVDAWDSCGFEALDRCRHGMALPPWLLISVEPTPGAA